MLSIASPIDIRSAPATPNALFTPFCKNIFKRSIDRLNTMFSLYIRTSSEPLPTPGLIITPEMRTQSELYLPIAFITSIFQRLYAAALSYPPILSSTPFYNSMSWADTFATLPSEFQFSANPARLLEALLDDSNFLMRFLFASFLPGRFYGGIGRYPGQLEFIRRWIASRNTKTVRCLDTACGTGEDTYRLAMLFAEEQLTPEEIQLDGWTLEPLEVWAATNRCFPHDPHRESRLQEATASIFQQGYNRSIRFLCQDVLNTDRQSTLLGETRQYDIILCNGLLGGPILNKMVPLSVAVGNLTNLLLPGGVLMAADHFHGGWKQKCPQSELRALFETYGLKCFAAGEGICGLKSD